MGNQANRPLVQDLVNDEGFQQAVARTSHGRRPVNAPLRSGDPK